MGVHQRNHGAVQPDRFGRFNFGLHDIPLVVSGYLNSFLVTAAGNYNARYNNGCNYNPIAVRIIRFVDKVLRETRLVDRDI